MISLIQNIQGVPKKMVIQKGFEFLTLVGVFLGVNKMELLQSQAPVDLELSGSSASARHGTFDIGH